MDRRFPMSIVDYASLSPSDLAEISSSVARHETLESVISWTQTVHGKGALRRLLDTMIPQDEFTFDVIVPWRDSITLVFDTT
jgi:hypothetical protein